MLIQKKNIVKRKIHDSYFLIDIKQNYLDDKCYIYELNPMGNLIWDSVDKVSSLTELAQLVKNKIDDNISFQQIMEDTKHFVDILIANEFLEDLDGRAK